MLDRGEHVGVAVGPDVAYHSETTAPPRRSAVPTTDEDERLTDTIRRALEAGFATLDPKMREHLVQRIAEATLDDPEWRRRLANLEAAGVPPKPGA